MKPSLILGAYAFAAVVLLSGCGNTRELEASLAQKEAAVDTLRKESDAHAAENRKLKSRVGELEKSLTNANAKAIDLERQLDQIRTELEKSKAKGKGDLEGAYRDALQKFMDRRYEESIAEFESLLAAGMPDPLNDNCHYWIGESLFGLRRYKEAVARFDEVLVRLRAVTAPRRRFPRRRRPRHRAAAGERRPLLTPPPTTRSSG